MIEEAEIFKVAAGLPVGERAAYLDTACAGYPEVQAAVQELLRMHAVAGFMEVQTSASLSPAVEAELARLKPEEVGERIGHYKLLEQIGEGGFGTVWVADQEQPVRRRVALKIIKLGMDTKEVMARFEQERQALALMDHPHIAKVFDAGATQWGRPYFVMELVRGVKITDYCDQANLPTAERLALFIQVCNAVQHAHQKGVIHRDLKPSNILVTLHEGLPVPKVIDFGIAKATAGRLSDATVYTQLNQFIGTPAYMSPEQAEMTSLDIDTRSDLYSLGVLLYELLVGQTPFDQETLLRAGLDEMRRVIREQEPPKPSTALQTMAADLRAGVALRRQEDSTKIAGRLRGDLDWIVMKALEKDRTRRYETANGLAQDIRRHLANEPVTAAAPSMPYLFRKFARRNKAALGVTVLIAAVLVAATGVSVWQAKLAIVAKKEATAKEVAERAAREESDAIAKFLTEVFESPDPSRDGLTITVAETLNRAAEKLEIELASQPARRAHLQRTLATTYGALGLARSAVPLNEKVAEYFRRVSGPEHPETLVAMLGLSHSYYDAGRAAEALKLAEEVLTVRRKRLGTDHAETLDAMSVVAVLYGMTGRRDEALQLQEVEVPLARRLLGPEHRNTIMAMNGLADSYSAKGRQNEAIELREEALRLSRKVLGPEHPETLTAMNNLAVSYGATGRREATLKLQEEVLMLRRKKQGWEHPETLIAMGNLATTYRDSDRRNEAIKLQEEVVALRPKVSGAQHPDTLLDVNELANYYAVDGRMEQALAMWAESSAADPKDTQLAEKVSVLQAWFRMDAAYAATCRRALTLAAGTDDPTTADRAAKGYCVLPSSDPELLEAAVQLARRAVNLGKENKGLLYFQMVLGMAEYRHGDDEAAGSALSAAEKLAGGNRSVFATARFFHAMSLARQDRLAEAGVSFAEATLRMPALPTDDRNPFRDGTGIDPIVAWLAYKEAKAALPAEVQARGREVIIKLAEEVLVQSRKKNGPEHKDTIAATQKLADAFCQAGRTDESVPLLAEISIQQPENTLLSLKVAALQLWFGKRADYLATSTRLIEQAEALPEDGYTAERAAKAWCLQNSSEPAVQQRALKLARQAALGEVHKSQRPWYQMTLGMAEYRAGNVPAAEGAFQAAEEAVELSTIQVSRFRSLIEGPARLYRAMILFRKGEEADARKLFVMAEAQMKPLPTDVRDVLANGVSQNDLTFWLAYQEARSVLQGDAAAASRKPIGN